jgi:RsiW-degrading membrane proteinase PrsW (M82 family)
VIGSLFYGKLLFMENQRQCVIPLHKPSRKELIFFFASGILVSIPIASFFEGFYPTAFSAALLIVILAPFIEETAKVFPLFYRHGETERSIVTLGLLIGLGFGIAEFIEYVAFVGVPPIARVPGIIFHASSAAITAYGIAKKNPLPYYLLTVTLHIANNFLALSGDIFFGVFAEVLVLISVYLLAWRFYHQASKEKMVI